MLNRLTIAGLVLFFSTAMSAHAEMVVNLGIASPGGNDLIVETDEELEAGAGLVGSVGLVHRKKGSPWSCQAMLGVKFNGVEFTGGEATIRAYPMHLMTYYKTKNIRYGVGLTYDFAIELDITGDNPRTIAYKNAPGIAVEFNHLLTERWYWGVRYTEMDYKEKGSGVKASANNLAGYVGMFF